MQLINTESKAGPHPCAAPACGPWRWAEEGQVIVWEEGQTVAFLEELEAIGERFGPRPSPVLPVLVYLLAACRGMFVDSHPSVQSARGQIKVSLEQAGSALRKLAALPRSLQTTAARAEIVQMICEDLPASLVSSAMAEHWKSWRNGGATNEPQPLLYYPSFYLGLMVPGLQAFSEEKLRNRLGLGLDDAPGPAPLPEAEPEEKGATPLSELLKDLANDEEMGGLAEVVRRVMAALVMPRKLSLRDDLPTGGVSDVANRGSPERLLITEIALDPDIMAVRMVMGESLYLRREPPAVRRDPPPLVLVDFSLRLWGLPRMFAAATALAILSSRNGDTPSQAWRIEKRIPRCLPLTRKEEVAAFLSHLEPELDPLPGLQAWLQALQDEPGDSERCFITHASQLRQGAFRTALRTMPRLLIATVDRDGAFALHSHEPSRGLRLLCEAVLPLESLFRESPRTVKHLTGGTGLVREPLFFQQTERPLLLSAAGAVSWALPMKNGGAIAVMDTGSVVCWSHSRSGCRLLFQAHEARAALFFHRISEERYALFLNGEKGRRNYVRAVILRTEDSPVEATLELGPVDPAGGITADGIVAFFVAKEGVQAFSLESGKLLGSRTDLALTESTTLPHGFWIGASGHAFRFDWNGTSIDSTTAFPPREKPSAWYWMEWAETLVSYSRVRGLCLNQEPVKTGSRDWLYAQFTEKLNTFGTLTPGPLGARVMLDQGTTRQIYELTPDKTPGTAPQLRLVTPQSLTGPAMFRRTGGLTAPSVSHTLHLKAAYLSPDGRLAIQGTRSGVWRWLILQANPVWKPGEALAADEPAIRAFRPEPASWNPRSALPAAKWANFIVWLDPDGLLHLACTDTTVPEVTLTLSDPSFAWWISEGTTGGRKFFHPPDAQESPIAVQRLRHVLTRMAECCHRP